MHRAFSILAPGAALVIGALAGCATPTADAPATGAPQQAQPVPPAQPTAPAAPEASAAPASAPASTAAGTPEQAAADTAATEQRFAAWIENFRASALAQGIDQATLDAAFDAVQLVPRVIDLDRTQSEFLRTVWDYLDITVSPQRVALGQQKIVQVREQADAAAARYGVPPHVLVAIWGIESHYGANHGNTPTIDALATLGFDGRREAWARSQLIAALKILQSGDIERTRMIGSWAGAMGQTQFLPSAFLAHAVDGDGDGRRDIWTSMADVLASTANFLASAGWRAGEPWGAEVLLPSGFDVGRADGALRQPSAAWAAEGVRTLDGTPQPHMIDAAMLLPAGARGPVFLVGANFRTILRYNNSINYALAVSLLAHRIAGGPGVIAAWPREQPALARSQLIEMQTALNARGFHSGLPDGLLGPATRDALRRYQRSVGLPADGYPTLELLHSLLAP